MLKDSHKFDVFFNFKLEKQLITLIINKGEGRMTKYRSYKKDMTFSYCFGAYGVFELVKYQSKQVKEVIFHHTFDKDKLVNELEAKNISYRVNDNLITKLSSKENCYVLAVFNKYESKLNENKPHLVLVNPSNMGNLGTIIRTMHGFKVKDLAIIKPGVDYFDPKVVRASMGSIFAINIEYFDSIDSYLKRFKNHFLYPFMLQSSKPLQYFKNDKKLFSLVFGNESSGLDESYLNLGQSLIIKHSDEIDSLNLTNAVSIALYEFFKDKFE